LRYPPAKNFLKIAPLQSFFCWFPSLSALFTSVILFNRFKKLCFLNRLFCSTDLKSSDFSHPKEEKGGNQKKKTLQGAIFKKFLAGGNAKHAHLAGG
jgi:hypothetical protein